MKFNLGSEIETPFLFRFSELLRVGLKGVECTRSARGSAADACICVEYAGHCRTGGQVAGIRTRGGGMKRSLVPDG